MRFLDALVLGIVEGITEFLPVSSTGHLLLAEHWLGYRESDAFIVVIQCGAAAAIVLLFKERVRLLLAGWRRPDSRDYHAKLLTAFAITGAGGLLLEAFDVTLPETVTPVIVALLVGGVLFLLVEHGLRGRTGSEVITWTMAVAIGLAQLVAAVFPGTSRSGATILVALALGLSRAAAVEFTFLLGVPTLLAAGALKLVLELRGPGGASLDWAVLLVGTAVAAVTSFLSVKWLLRYVQTHTFSLFGWYRIVLGGALLLAALRG